MASQESRDKEGEGGRGGEEGVEGREQVASSQLPDQPENEEDNRRIGPWHPPDYQRQKVLADRLSDPAQHSKRPATSAQSSEHPPTPLSLHSPYRPSPHSRASTTTSPQNQRQQGRMNTSRGSSGPPSSPRRECSPRRQTCSAGPHYGPVSPRRQPPLFATPATSRRVNDEQLDEIVGRVTKPTVASRGGVDLLDKDFTYIQTPRLKTLPVVPGLERRYLGLQRVDSARMDEIVYRLTRMTSAYKAKFAPNKNVYVDLEPGAHLVALRRSAQSAV